MAHRFFVSPEQVHGQFITVLGEDVQHISKVLRLKTGAEVVIADGTGSEYFGEIAQLDKNKVLVAIHRQETASGAEPLLEVTLLQGIPKGDKMEFIIQKCTELGISRIVPVETTRTVVQLTEEKAYKKQERWQKIAMEAAKQCQRTSIPIIEPVQSLDKALQALNGQILIVPWEEEKEVGLKSLLQQLKNQEQKTKQKIAFLIGPEGGLDGSEITLAQKFDARTVTLGSRILRTETAGLAVLVMAMYEMNELGVAGNDH
ncbi:16S rRNA (uracil(1498)-N(3))-methyltransferase [Bacillota bacterium LX-D]|nr:16S rRNA (uracil(1498)-N(3))-methyltransferase [Bacillota bacterium LX-D]